MSQLNMQSTKLTLDQIQDVTLKLLTILLNNTNPRFTSQIYLHKLAKPGQINLFLDKLDTPSLDFDSNA